MLYLFSEKPSDFNEFYHLILRLYLCDLDSKYYMNILIDCLPLFNLQSCEHNTTGPKCGQCLPGFYGNAENGEIDDCKPCACPLTEASNNFSAACIANGTDDYTCTQCSKGYAGQHCEELVVFLMI